MQPNRHHAHVVPFSLVFTALVAASCVVESADRGAPTEARRVPLSAQAQAELESVGVAEVRVSDEVFALLDGDASLLGLAYYDASGSIEVTLDGDRYDRRVLGDGSTTFACNEVEVSLENAADEAAELAALRETCDAPIRVAHALDVRPADAHAAADGDRFAAQTPDPDGLRAGPCVTWTNCLTRGAGGGCTSSQTCHTSVREFEHGVCHANCVECDAPWDGC